MFKKQNAFTLIELMVTLVVLGVVLAVALPSFKSQILRNKSEALGDDLATALSFVRSEAIRQGSPQRTGTTARFITLCASSNGTTCSTDAKDWSNAFIAVIDTATSEDAAVPVVDSTTGILKVWTKTDSNAFVDVLPLIDGELGSSVKFIRFTSLGKLAITSQKLQGFTIKTKMKDVGKTPECIHNSARLTRINLVGMINTESVACSDFD